MKSNLISLRKTACIVVGIAVIASCKFGSWSPRIDVKAWNIQLILSENGNVSGFEPIIVAVVSSCKLGEVVVRT